MDTNALQSQSLLCMYAYTYVHTYVVWSCMYITMKYGCVILILETSRWNLDQINSDLCFQQNHFVQDQSSWIHGCDPTETVGSTTWPRTSLADKSMTGSMTHIQGGSQEAKQTGVHQSIYPSFMSGRSTVTVLFAASHDTVHFTGAFVLAPPRGRKPLTFFTTGKS